MDREMARKRISVGDRDMSLLCAMYPEPVAQIFLRIYEALRELIDCDVVVVGSFSDGTAKLIEEGSAFRFVSDIDLLAVVEDLDDVMRSRLEVARSLDMIANSLPHQSSGFHIGLRYRTIAELPEFIRKVRSLGYDFPRSAVQLQKGPLRDEIIVPRDIQGHALTVGEAAENICSILWAVLIYSSPGRGIIEGRRSVVRALRCMRSTMAAFELYAEPAELSIIFDVQEGCLSEDKVLFTDLLSYAKIAILMCEKFGNSCCLASESEEFDFFRVMSANYEILPRLLAVLLNLDLSIELGRSTEEHVHESVVLARRMGLGGLDAKDKLSSGDDCFYAVRQALARRRMALSELFRRDRGPGFLRSLTRERTKPLIQPFKDLY